jgi:hypothetical protein
MFEILTVKLNALCKSRAKIASFSSLFIFTFLHTGSSIQTFEGRFAFLCKFFLHTLLFIQTHKQGLEIQTALFR